MMPLLRHLVILLLLAVSGLLCAQERFADWHTEIELREDRSAEVTETIRVVVEGNIFKRGITRTLPEPVSIIGVERDGQQEPYHQESANDRITIYAGQREVLLDPGTYTYRLRYRVPDAVKALEGLDELDFNLIGSQVEVPIERLAATVRFAPPIAIGAPPMQYACYTGRRGDKQRECTISRPADGAMTFTGQGSFGQGRVMTVAVGFAPGAFAYAEPVREPTTLELYGSLLLLLVGGLWGSHYAYQSWRRYGIDPPSPEVQPLYAPPRGLSPAALAYVGGGFGDDNAHFTASLLGLAMAEYVKIIPEEKKSIFGDTVTYSLRALSQPPPLSRLPAEQRALYEGLFAKKREVKLTPTYDHRFRSLFREHGEKLRELHHDEITEGHQSSRVLPLLGILAGTVLLALLMRHPLSPGWVTVAIVIFGIASVIGLIVYLYAIRKPTPERVRFLAEVDAFRRYLELPERERDALPGVPEMDVVHYEALLPYAIAFGIHTGWTEYFAELLATRDYRPHFVGGRGRYTTFAFTTNLASTIDTSTTPPSGGGGGSSSSGGSGSAGGGSSGGGGAGGW